jgi:hypothetical protein
MWSVNPNTDRRSDVPFVQIVGVLKGTAVTRRLSGADGIERHVHADESFTGGHIASRNRNQDEREYDSAGSRHTQYHRLSIGILSGRRRPSQYIRGSPKMLTGVAAFSSRP